MTKTSPGLTIGVIGGGLIGLATAYKLAQLGLQAKIVVLEKEGAVCLHQSGRNSGVLHCGLYYKPGSLKAKLAVYGLAEMVEFCRIHNIPYEICGKIVVATNKIEEERLLALRERGLANGLQNLRMLTRSEMVQIEPHVEGLTALHVPQEGIVDYKAVGKTLVHLLEASGHEVRTGHRVLAIDPVGSTVKVRTNLGLNTFSFVVICAGAQSDRVYRMSGNKPHSRIIPFKGEYYLLSEKGNRLVKNMIYPVPDPSFPFLGVHFTRMLGGRILAGPNASLVFDREGYGGLAFSPTDTWDAVSFPGLSKFLLRYPKASWTELANSLSKTVFLKNLRKLVPSITSADLGKRWPSGIRAQAMGSDGQLQLDFEFCEESNQIHVINAPSPGATASLAIGEHISGRVKNMLS